MKRFSYGDEFVNGISPITPTMMDPETQLPARTSSSSAIVPTFCVDALLLFVAGLAAFLFSRAVGLAEISPALQGSLIAPPVWLMLVVILISPVWFLFLDGLSTLSNRLKLPFSGSQRRAQRIYAERIHFLLLAFYFCAILVALCWSAPGMVLFSKLFLSAVFAIAIFALGKSIPSARLSFILSGALFVVVLIATQAFIVLKMRAEQAEAEQLLREQLELNQNNREDLFNNDEEQ